MGLGGKNFDNQVKQIYKRQRFSDSRLDPRSDGLASEREC
jgi:hypothetical protein